MRTTLKIEDVKKEILEFMKDKAKRPLSLKDLSKSFHLGGEERRLFKRLLNELVSNGELVRIRGGRFGFPGSMNLVTGELICHPDGFGFVRPEDGLGEDIFINPRKLSGAMHGDCVVARVDGYKAKGKREGTILRILKRAHKTVVGKFQREDGFGVVVPSDERMLDKILIPPSDRKGAKDGQIVSAEITKWPTRGSGPVGKIIEIIGEPEDPQVEADVILRKFGLPNRFPNSVTHEVKSVPPSVAENDVRGRVDLRDKKTFTIDGETAKDFDDAVSIEKTPHGARLFVSIADVSHYVKEGSNLDREAYERGTSVYFPDRCIPMLPEALSNGICSLNPHVDRLTLTAELEFSPKGILLKKRFYESVIRSAERLTYTNVKKVLSNEDPSLSKRYSHVIDDLKLMESLAERLMEERAEAGSIDFDLPEPQIIIDIEGKVEDIVRSERNIAHRIIEEFMLAANKAVATEFAASKLPFLYRVHEAPDEEALAEYRDFVAGFGLQLKPGAGPKALQRVLEEAKGRPEERLVNHVLLRSMKQAVYSETNIGHFGLSFDNYTHFTSPIRRYPDLVVHRLLKLHINHAYSRAEKERMEEVLPEITLRTSLRERKAMEAEREIVDLKKCQFMKDKEGETFDAFISGVTSFGLFVELKEYFVEGLIHVSNLRDDYYIFDEKKHSLIGENTRRVYRVGDPVEVTIGRVDLERRRIDALLAEAPGRSRSPRKKGRRS